MFREISVYTYIVNPFVLVPNVQCSYENQCLEDNHVVTEVLESKTLMCNEENTQYCRDDDFGIE